MTRFLALAVLTASLIACGADDAAPVQETPAAPVPPAAELAVSDAFTTAAPAGRTGGVFMTVSGSVKPDTLLAARSAVAERVEVHESYDTEGGLRGMREVTGIPIPAGGTVALAPGGYHVMLLNLTRELAVGDTVDVELEFASGNVVPVRVPVQSLDAMPRAAQ